MLTASGGTFFLSGCGGRTVAGDERGIVASLSGVPASANKAAAPEPRYVDQLGQSIDSVTDKLKQLLATGEKGETDVSPDEGYRQNSLQWSMIEDQSAYQARIRSSAKGHGRFALFSGSGGGSTSKIEAKNSYSLSVNCIAMRHSKCVLFKGRPKLDAEMAKFIRRNSRDKARLLRELGDSYVHAVIPANSLFVEILFNTSSKSKMKELTASVSGSLGSLGGGSGSYAQLIGNARSHKGFEVRAWGVDGNDVLTKLTAQEIAAALGRFFADDTRPKFANCVYKPVSFLVDDDGPLNFADEADRLARERFATRVTECLEILDNARADAVYVGQNRGEFDPSTVSRASDDLPIIRDASLKVQELGEDTFAMFQRSGKTDASFDRGRIDAVMPKLLGYDQREPAAVQPPRRREPQRDADRGRNDTGIGGLGGIR